MSAKQLLRRYLDKLDRLEAIEFSSMSVKWDRLFQPIVDEAKNLTEKELRARIEEADTEYATHNARLITNGQRRFGREGLKSAQEMLDLSGRDYERLEEEDIDNRAGRTVAGIAIAAYLLSRYKDTEIIAVSVSVEEIGSVLGRNLSNSIATARTEQMDVFREVQTDQFVQSNLVEMKNWVGEPDACSEICEPGIEESPYPLSYVMDTHPNCRCGWEPVFIDFSEVD